MKITTYLKCLLLVVLFIVATQPFFLKAQDDSDLAEWTFMVYIAADNNLETFAIRDMAEMEFNGSTEDVNIVVQIDRAQGFSREDGDWEGARRYYITKQKGLGINSEVVADLGDVNMADAATLADFGKWAMTTYPAQRYALVLWDHGASWFGFAQDLSAGNSLMSLPELDTALADITRTTGVEKLDIIGFDACLMGGYEVYRMLQPYAHYAIASETLIPGLGWDYDFTLLDLIENPEMDGLAFGKKIVDNFTLFYDNEPLYHHYSLSLIDMNAMSQLDETLPAFVRQINAATTTPESVTLARNATLRFGSLSGDFTRDFNSSLGLIDMFGFIENIKSYTSDSTLIDAAQKLLDVRDSIVVYHQSSQSLQRSNGMSVYFPTNQIRPQPDDNTIRYGINSEDPWAQALLEFYTNLALYGGNPASAQFGTAEAGTDGINVPVGSTNFEVMQQTVFTLAGDNTIVNYETFDPTQPIVWQPEGAVFKYGDSAENVVAFANDSIPDTYSIRGEISNESGDTFDVEWYFDNVTGEPGVMWALTPDITGNLAYSEYRPYAGDSLRLYTYRLEGTDVTVDVSPNTYAVGEVDTDEFAVEPLEDTDGQYTVVVVLHEVTGQTVETELEVEVQDGQFNVISQTVAATATPEPVILPTTTPVPALASGGTCNPDTANYCLAGQLWGDGRCESDDPYITAYNYQLGWYRAAYECEVIDTYPEGFAPPIVPEETEEPCTSLHPMYPNC